MFGFLFNKTMKKEIFKISVPLFVLIPRKTKKDKKFILNLNTYRNTHFFILNEAKKLYSEKIKKDLLNIKKQGFDFNGKWKILLTYYNGSNRIVDKSNPCSIIEKFVCDAMTNYKLWEDDNSNINPISTYEFGGVDKTNPRCDITFISLYSN